jgi:hypothetical protein
MFSIDYRQTKETLQKYLKIILGKIKRTKCDDNCWHYGMFGGEGGCEALDSWGSIHEDVKPGQLCLHPDKKEYGIDLGVVSSSCFCSALSGGIEGIVVNSENDKKFVEVLTNTDKK